MQLRKWVQSRSARGVFSFSGWCIAVAVSFWTSNHPWATFWTCALSLLWPMYLFGPEIKKLKLTRGKNDIVESPVWLYLFGVASVVLGLFAIYHLWDANRSLPEILTDAEMAQPYIHGKFLTLSQFVNTDNRIEGRTFEDCSIYGPLVMTADKASSIVNCDFNAIQDQVFLESEKALIGRGTGIVMLKDCKFRRCRFYNVSFIAPKSVVDHWRADNPGIPSFSAAH